VQDWADFKQLSIQCRMSPVTDFSTNDTIWLRYMVEQVDRQASQLERGKKHGKVVDNRSMAWGCEELFGVIGVI